MHEEELGPFLVTSSCFLPRKVGPLPTSSLPSMGSLFVLDCFILSIPPEAVPLICLPLFFHLMRAIAIMPAGCTHATCLLPVWKSALDSQDVFNKLLDASKAGSVQSGVEALKSLYFLSLFGKLQPPLVVDNQCFWRY